MKTLILSGALVLAFGLSGAAEASHPSATTDPTPAGLQSNGFKINGINLQGVKFQGVKFQGVKFQGVKFQGTKFQGMHINGSRESAIEAPALRFHGLQQGPVRVSGRH